MRLLRCSKSTPTAYSCATAILRGARSGPADDGSARGADESIDHALGQTGQIHLAGRIFAKRADLDPGRCVTCVATHCPALPRVSAHTRPLQ